ncbi:MAG: DUF3240 family protein [Rhodocyclales bacterium]|nr:DUF3240 family protein [Rhodocyclales bacterium]
MSATLCLTLLLSQTLEEEVIDILLLHYPEQGGRPFITTTVDGHGTAGHMSSANEQVRGRTARTRIDILVEAEHATSLINSLRDKMPGAVIDWWLAPVIDSGTLGL